MSWRILAVLGCAFWLPHATPAQAQDKIPRIGFLTQCPASFDQQPFTRALGELGYVEGKNILIVWRRFPENVAQLRTAADELVSSKIDIIVTCATDENRSTPRTALPRR